jgi:NAD(P)-dependent dehydrogenase (short-subunit alcohol dehydrogenase family)
MIVNEVAHTERRANMKKVWFITGAGRGMGVDFAKAALAAGFAVVATGRNTDAVTKAVGKSNDLLVVKLDVTRPAEAEAAARAAVERFGRIDVLVNNAGNFYAGYFAETMDRSNPRYTQHRSPEREPGRDQCSADVC